MFPACRFLSFPAARTRAGAWPVALAFFLALPMQAVVHAQPAAAALDARAVTVELRQSKVVRDASGAERLVDAAAVLPGDVIEYSVTYKNTSARPVSGLVANLPVPEGLEYLPASARPGAALVQAAARDGVFGAEPLQRRLADGKAEPLPYNEYRALRWRLGQLPAGGETMVKARARVEKVPAPAVGAASAAR